MFQGYAESGRNPALKCCNSFLQLFRGDGDTTGSCQGKRAPTFHLSEHFYNNEMLTGSRALWLFLLWTRNIFLSRTVIAEARETRCRGTRGCFLLLHISSEMFSILSLRICCTAQGVGQQSTSHSMASLLSPKQLTLYNVLHKYGYQAKNVSYSVLTSPGLSLYWLEQRSGQFRLSYTQDTIVSPKCQFRFYYVANFA